MRFGRIRFSIIIVTTFLHKQTKMQNFSKEEQQAIMDRVNATDMCKSARELLEQACGAWCVKCCDKPIGWNDEGEIELIFHGDCQTKDREKKEQVEREINESGIATATFRALPQRPGYIQVGYAIKIDFAINS